MKGRDFDWQAGFRDRREQRCIDALDKIVAALVGAIDGALDLGDDAVGCVGVACTVFQMPEIEVGAMQLKNNIVVAGWWGVVVDVPQACVLREACDLDLCLKRSEDVVECGVV